MRVNLREKIFRVTGKREHSFVTVLPLAAEQVVEQVGGELGTPWVSRVLAACLEKPLKSVELQGLIGAGDRLTFRRKYLARLLDHDLLERTVPDKPTSRLQKYRLTEKEKKFLAAEKQG